MSTKIPQLLLQFKKNITKNIKVNKKLTDLPKLKKTIGFLDKWFFLQFVIIMSTFTFKNNSSLETSVDGIVCGNVWSCVFLQSKLYILHNCWWRRNLYNFSGFYKTRCVTNWALFLPEHWVPIWRTSICQYLHLTIVLILMLYRRSNNRATYRWSIELQTIQQQNYIQMIHRATDDNTILIS